MQTVDIPISAAKKVALDFGYDQVIIIGRKCGVGGREHCTTYGVDKKHCAVAARAGDFLKYNVMKWAAAESIGVAKNVVQQPQAKTGEGISLRQFI